MIKAGCNLKLLTSNHGKAEEVGNYKIHIFYPLSHKLHAGHALDFIRYAATVQGNFEIANKAAWNMADRIKGDAVMVKWRETLLTSMMWLRG